MSMTLPDETIATPETTWATLAMLRREPKFVPHEYPPLGYTGPDTPEDLEPLTEIVDQAIDGSLALRAEALSASILRPILVQAQQQADMFATEDRDRVWGYMLEIWYIVGFRVSLFGATYGTYFQVPDGYGEPLPPGWNAPDQPRRFES